VPVCLTAVTSAAPILHVTNGDAVVPELAAAAGVDAGDVLVWRDVLHDGPVPGGLGPDELARVRARHLTSRQWSHAGTVEASEAEALAMLRERDARLASHPAEAEVVLWFEDDLFDALLLAQVEDRLAGRPGPVSRVDLPHPPRGDLAAAFAARRPVEPEPAAFAALRSPDPRAWTGIPAFARLLEELPDAGTGLTRLEKQVLEALDHGPLAPYDLFHAVTADEHPPWLGDAPLFALVADLEPFVSHTDGTYELTFAGRAILDGEAARPRIDRWLGGVHLGPGRPDWAWDAAAGRPVRLD
jgi:Domain of unknown function (DUF1835)